MSGKSDGKLEGTVSIIVTEQTIILIMTKKTHI